MEQQQSGSLTTELGTAEGLTVTAEWVGSQLVGELLHARATVAAQRPFLRCGASDYSYADMDRRAALVAGAASDLGLAVGDRVAILSLNRPEVLELYFGLARAGIIQVPLNAFLKGEFLRYQLQDAQATALITDAAGWHVAKEVLAELPSLQHVILLDELPEAQTNAAVTVSLFETLMAAARPQEKLELSPDVPMSILYTSGTTGLPKGCVLSHGYYLTGGWRTASANELTIDDVFLTALPLYHAMARIAVIAATLVAGCAAVIEEEFRADNFVERASEVGATVAMGVGAMGAAILAQPDRATDRAHELRTFMLVPYSVEQQQALAERFGLDAHAEMYGQTECLGITWTPKSNLRARDSIGQASADLEVVVLNEAGGEVGVDEVGEICVRPQRPRAMFDGYWRNPEATVAALKGLWYHSGDLAVKRSDGSFRFVDRKKDAVRRSGENIASFEVEQAILKHPDIADAAIHAVPAASGEDDVKAVIVLQQGCELGAIELFGFFRDNLPYFAIPRYVELVDALPRNAVGRVMKWELRERPPVGPHGWDFRAQGLRVERAQRR